MNRLCRRRQDTHTPPLHDRFVALPFSLPPFRPPCSNRPNWSESRRRLHGGTGTHVQCAEQRRVTRVRAACVSRQYVRPLQVDSGESYPRVHDDASRRVERNRRKLIVLAGVAFVPPNCRIVGCARVRCHVWSKPTKSERRACKYRRV